MHSSEIFQTALTYEEKIRDLYQTAAALVDDERGKTIFRSLAEDEQSHVEFLLYSLEQLKKNGVIDIDLLKTPIPSRDEIESNIDKLQAQIPRHMLGDVKTVLNSALQMEKETSAFYKQASEDTEGHIRKVFEKFLDIEQRHVDVVQIELDHALHNGMWFNFMEVNLEAE